MDRRGEGQVIVFGRSGKVPNIRTYVRGKAGRVGLAIRGSCFDHVVQGTVSLPSMTVQHRAVPLLFFLFSFSSLEIAGGRSGTGQRRGPAHFAGGNRLHPDTATGQGIFARGTCLLKAVTIWIPLLFSWLFQVANNLIQSDTFLAACSKPLKRRNLHGRLTGTCWLLQPTYVSLWRCVALAVSHIYSVSSEL